MQARLEHVNLTVADPERSAALIERLFGWEVRWAGPSMNGGRTIHIGSGSQYLALYTPAEREGAPGPWAKGVPLNHVAFEVEDLDAVERRVEAAGLTPFAHGDYEPGRRFYFFDENCIEYEVVSYAAA
ncbi:MAG: VOC family protein [Alphaproteobacteria bacterium]|nr:MAG: VOC family protein [Alphaproteobacteria bacterium]